MFLYRQYAPLYAQLGIPAWWSIVPLQVAERKGKKKSPRWVGGRRSERYRKIEADVLQDMKRCFAE